MKKRYKFTLDLSVEINDQLLAQKCEKSKKMEILFQEFLKDDKAIMSLYKLWLLGDLRIDEHYEKIKESLHPQDEKDIILPILKKCPDSVKSHFSKVLSSENDIQFKELEDFFDQFEMLKFAKASFQEIN
jgi:hypothetical protein